MDSRTNDFKRSTGRRWIMTIALVALLTPLIALIVIKITSQGFTSSWTYQTAVELAQGSVLATATLGEPIQASRVLRGSTRRDGKQRLTELRIQLHGPASDGVLHAAARSDRRSRTLQLAEITTPEREEPIDLLAEAQLTEFMESPVRPIGPVQVLPWVALVFIAGLVLPFVLWGFFKLVPVQPYFAPVIEVVAPKWVGWIEAWYLKLGVSLTVVGLVSGLVLLPWQEWLTSLALAAVVGPFGYFFARLTWVLRRLKIGTVPWVQACARQVAFFASMIGAAIVLALVWTWPDALPLLYLSPFPIGLTLGAAAEWRASTPTPAASIDTLGAPTHDHSGP